MNLTTQLFESTNLKLDFYDPEKDASEESSFTYDLNYTWGISFNGEPKPLTAFEIKKMREEQLKKADETGTKFYFTVRRKADNQFLGVIMFPWISWTHRTAAFRVLIGDTGRWGEYLAEALRLALRYAFEELNLYSVDCYAGEFQPDYLEACRRAGMQERVRQREMVFRAGRLWDRVMMVLNQADWQKLQHEE